MCNTYTIILKCNHKQNYTHRCPLYLGTPRQKCVKTPPTIAHYFVSCRKCRGQESDEFVVQWVERENESDSSTVGGKEGDWRKGEESNYMLAIGTFEILANGDETGRVKGVRVHENGTEEARREKKGLKNVSLDLSGTNKASFDAGTSHDIYDQINESTQELKLDGLRTQSLPIKSKSKKSNVFGSLRKMIVRPKSEQDTAATGEHKSPTQGTVKSKLIKFNTITGGFRGGKKSEDMEEESSLSASADDRRVDDATGYEYLTPKEFLDLHFQGVVAGSSGTEIAISNAVSAPIEIPQSRQDNAAQKWTAERRAGEYMSEISRNPFADNPAVADPYIRDSTISDVENSYQEETPERWSHDTHSSGPGRMSRGTEFSQSDEERMNIITEEIDGDTINLTPDNIDDVLAVWKGGFGTSSPSSPTHIPPRPHALSHSVHSLSTEALPTTTPFQSHGSSLDVAGYSVSLPNAQGDENRIAGARWTPENDSEKVSSATLQRVIDFVESPGCLDIPQRNNTPSSIHQAPAKTQPLLPNIQEPTQETIAGTRYSSLPSSTTILSPPRKGKPSEQGRESPRIWNRKGTPASKPEPRTNLPVPERTIDRISTMTTISQFIPSRNGDLDEEITTNLISPKTSTKVSRRRIGSSNMQHPIQNHANAIPEVPAIPKTYAKHVTVLPKIGRDATGRFSVEHIKEEEHGIVRSSMDKKVPGEVSREELAEGSVDVYANHTIGTWDAVLRNSPGDVSPVSPLEGNASGKSWDGEEGQDLYVSREICKKSSGLLSQLTHPSTSPTNFFSTSPHSQKPPLSTLTPPQSPHYLSSSPSSLHPPLSRPQQHLHFHLHSQSPSPSSLHHTPPKISSDAISPLFPHDFNLDPSIPHIRPLRIRKKNPVPVSRKTEMENLEEMEERRRRRERMEEEFRRADERLRGLRDGRGGL